MTKWEFRKFEFPALFEMLAQTQQSAGNSNPIPTFLCFKATVNTFGFRNGVLGLQEVQ